MSKFQRDMMGYSSSHMNKELTPMQRGINELQKRIDNWKSFPCENDNQKLSNDYHIKGLQEAIQVLTILLPKERTMVEDAWDAAIKWHSADTFDEKFNSVNKSNYFTSKYISND